MSSLFEPYRLGSLTLPNRLVMAPLTRNRAAPGAVPTPLMAEYYGQRAGAGLIVSEATQISQQGQGYQDTPGIYTPEQVEAWKAVTRAVHDKGGRIFLQLWHVGRISHVALQPNGAAPVAPSAIRANAQVFVNNAFADVSEPRALRLEEIPDLIDDYRRAAANAIAAGFDGVEVHAANGYLLDQFLRDGTNKRTDTYGGSIENRGRLLLEVVAAVAREIGAERTGLRISPVSPFGDISDSDPWALFSHVVQALNATAPAYLHVVEGATGGSRDEAPGFDFRELRRLFKGTYIANNGYDQALAEQTLQEDGADLVAFGRLFIANPDLVERLRRGAPLNELKADELYGGGAEGYTDYPALAA